MKSIELNDLSLNEGVVFFLECLLAPRSQVSRPLHRVQNSVYAGFRVLGLMPCKSITVSRKEPVHSMAASCGKQEHASLLVVNTSGD